MCRFCANTHPWHLREWSSALNQRHLKSEPALQAYMGGSQNYGPCLGTLNSRCRIMIGTPEGTIILTTSHILVATCLWYTNHIGDFVPKWGEKIPRRACSLEPLQKAVPKHQTRYTSWSEQNSFGPSSFRTRLKWAIQTLNSSTLEHSQSLLVVVWLRSYLWIQYPLCLKGGVIISRNLIFRWV